MRRLALILAAVLCGVIALAHAPAPPGLVRLPCADRDLPAGSYWLYCVLGRNYTIAEGEVVVREAQRVVAAEHGPSPLTWLDASGPIQGTLWPHRSHGDGRQIDLALYYETQDGAPLRRPPTITGYFAFEPPRPGERKPCQDARPFDPGDPAADRRWRWDQARTETLTRTLIADPRVRRIFIEPHLADRMGLSGHPKVRFAGCRAARHDDHIHIDLH